MTTTISLITHLVTAPLTPPLKNKHTLLHKVPKRTIILKIY